MQGRKRQQGWGYESAAGYMLSRGTREALKRRGQLSRPAEGAAVSRVAIWGEYSRQREWQEQRPWGRVCLACLGASKEASAVGGWEVSGEEEERRSGRRRAGVGLVGHCEGLDFCLLRV